MEDDTDAYYSDTEAGDDPVVEPLPNPADFPNELFVQALDDNLYRYKGTYGTACRHICSTPATLPLAAATLQTYQHW